MTPTSGASGAAATKEARIPELPPTAPSGINQMARQVPGNGSNAKNNLFAAMNRTWVHASYTLVDLLLIGLSGTLAFGFRFLHFLTPWPLLPGQLSISLDFPLKPYLGFLLLYAILIVLFFQSQDLYRTPRERLAFQETREVLRGVGMATLVLAAFIFCSNVKIVSREVVGISALLNVAFLASWRVWKRQFVIRRVEQGLAMRNVLIVGAGKIGQELALLLDKNKQLGYRFVGFLDPAPHSDRRLLGKIEDLPQIARAKFVDEVFLAMAPDRDLVNRVAKEARRLHLNVRLIPEMYEGFPWNAPLRFIGAFPVIELHRESIPTLGLFVKRVVDVVLSAAALLVLSPLFLVITLVICLDSPGEIFHRAKRIGQKGVPFVCYKFRSMVMDAERRKEELRAANERQGPFFKMEEDPRVTRTGRWLRKFSLDELPQLVNVLKGEMSLVGPRPHPLDDYERYDIEHLRRLDMKPGITGLWQVTARRDPSFDTNMALDLQYISNWSLRSDLILLLKTLPVVARGDGR